MTRTDFSKFVEQTLEEAIRLAEQHTGATLPREIVFRWMTQRDPIHDGIVDVIVNRVFVDDEHIYPVVDIGVVDLTEDGKPIVIANVAGYPPCSFRKNRMDRDGPFIYLLPIASAMHKFEALKKDKL